LCCCTSKTTPIEIRWSGDNDEEMWRWDQCVLSLSLSASCWPSGFFRTCQSSLRSGSSDSRRAMTRLSSDPGMRPPRCSLSEGRFCTWRFTEDQPFVRWVLLLNVLLNLPKPATIFFVGTLWAANRARPTFSQQIHPKHTHKHTARICQTHTHTPWQDLWIWNSISGTIFPSKRLSWSIILNILECFQIPQAWAIPKVRGHGARATPSWPHRSTGETVGCFSKTGKTYNTRCKSGNDWGLLLGNHVKSCQS